MKNNIRFCHLVILCAFFLPGFTPQPALSQTSIVIKADDQLEFAESYFAKGEYYRAISEYERFIHFFPQDPRVELAMYKVGLSYLKGERFKEAIGSFYAVAEKYHDTELAIKSHFNLSECYVHLRQFAKALGALDVLLSITENPDIKDDLFYREGWIYLEMDEWEKAQSSFDKISPKNRNTYRLKQLSEHMSKKKSLKTKNPTAAGWLAAIPGAGHLYCERYRDAFIAFLLNGAMICAAYEAFDHDNEALGGLITFFEIGLYTGNIYSAVSSAHKYNRRQKWHFLQRLKDHSRVGVSTMKLGKGLVLSYKITF